MTLTPGTVLGRLEIRSRLGAGGMGEVFLARDLGLDRPVAVKVLSARQGLDEAALRAFRGEARAASALNHPNIVTVHDLLDVGGVPCLVTEFVDGQTLRMRMGQGPMPPGEALDVTAQVLAALAAAEEAGIVHRDIKPENVMVRKDGLVKVLDFGLAQRVGAVDAGDDGGRGGERDGGLVGTVRYMSPEQLRGLPLDSRSDLWSVGVLLYEMLTGEPPFRGSSSGDLVVSILTRIPRGLAERTGEPVPPVLEALVRRALAKPVEERWRSCREMLVRLEAIRGSRSAGAAPLVAGSSPSPTDSQDDPTARISPSDPGGTWREIAAALASTSGSSALPDPAARLPLPATPLLGREKELGDLFALLAGEGVRLVTLTGPGGTGKTRLALEAARGVSAGLAGGAFFVALESIRDPRLVPDALARALGIPEERLFEALAGVDTLVVLDNFEQVQGATPFVAELLARTRALRLLVTSRERLRIDAEREFPVPPLAAPSDLSAAADPAEVLAIPSVALFVERARAARPGFALTRENAGAVREICARLEGLPLAIELAAARVRVLAPAGILDRLDRRLAILTGGGADRTERQRTMRGAIEWGYNLLGAGEKSLFARLSVFAGGFDLAAAEAVAAGEDDVLDGLAALADRSLLEVREAGSEVRYRMLEILREFAAERLAESAEAAEAPRRQAAHFAARAAALRGDLAGGKRQAAALESLEAEHANLRVALRTLLDDGAIDAALALAADLSWFWYLHGHYAEGRRWLGEALGRGGSGASRARALAGAGILAFLQCDYDEASRRLAECRDEATKSGDSASLAKALQCEGSIARERGDLAGAVARHRESLDLWRRLGDEREVARSTNYIAFASWLAGDLGAARRAVEATLPLLRVRADREGLAWARLHLAAVGLHGGDLAEAARQGKEALLLSREVGYAEGVAWAMDLLGRAALREGRSDGAVELLRGSYARHRELGDRWRMSSVLEALAAATVGDDPERAARLGGCAEALREQAGTPVPPVEQGERERWIAAAGAALGGRFDDCWAEGRSIADPLG